jgi:hypothetical protein
MHNSLRSRSNLIEFATSLALALTFAAPAPEAAARSRGQPYEAIERLPQTQLQLPGLNIVVARTPGVMSVDDAELHHWIESSARAVADYFGRFPVRELQLLVIANVGDRVRSGSAFGEHGAAVRVIVGMSVDAEALRRDWILVHEMVHVAIPNLARSHHWLEEGVAVYVESIARMQRGDLTREEVWLGLLDGMPHGLPQAGDRGLDFTPTWGRTYWGGALFCLLADLEIRRQTDNRLGLQQALQGLVVAGGSIEKDWPIIQVLQAGDWATGTTALIDVYQRMRSEPMPVDLPALWANLGVQREGDTVRFDDTAPLAAARLAIESPPALAERASEAGVGG